MTLCFPEEMDDTDRKLLLLIFGDPRMPLRELAKRLGVSRQAVHHRLRKLTRAGVFRHMRAAISLHYLDQPIVAIWGRSRNVSVNQVLDKLGESDLTAWARVAGGNEILVIGGLRSVADLDGYVHFVKEAAEMPEPTIGIMNFGDGINPECYNGGRRKDEYRRLTPLDLRIITALQEDARMPVARIAREVGVSAKTVRRHLEIMRSEGSLDFDEPWDLPPGEDMFTMLYVSLRGGADKIEVGRRLLKIDPVHLVVVRSFSNLPSFLLGLVSSDRMCVIRDILAKVAEDEDVSSVVPNLLYFERMYTTWDQKLPAALARYPEMAGARRRRPESRVG